MQKLWRLWIVVQLSAQFLLVGALNHGPALAITASMHRGEHVHRRAHSLNSLVSTLSI